MSRAHPATRHIPDFTLPDITPQFSVSETTDIVLSEHHYREPEVNRLKARAMAANADMVRSRRRETTPYTLPAGFAISFMIGSSLVIWSVVAGIVSLAL